MSQPAATPPDPAMVDAILGIEVAATVGHSMGDITEGMHWSEIEREYGVLDRMLPQYGKFKDRVARTDVRGHPFVYHAHDRPPGMSEDGHERHRLSTTAVIERQGRVTVDDVAAVWARDIDPERFGYLLGPQDQVIYYALRAGVPPAEVGRYAIWPGAWGVTAMMVPIGIVNGGDPATAARDARDVGRLKDRPGVPGNVALDVAAGLAAGVAAGLSAGSSPATVIDAVLDALPPEVRAEMERAIDAVPGAGDWRPLRDYLDSHYDGRSILWPVETLGTALAVLRACDADPARCVVASVNLGRDADGRAFAAGAMAAAIRGAGTLPPEWEAQLAEQVVSDPYTVSRRTPDVTADGLARALQANVTGLQERIDRITARAGVAAPPAPAPASAPASAPAGPA